MNQGPGGDGPQSIGRFLVGPAVAAVMALLLIGLYSVIPHHEPRLDLRGPRHPKVQNGFWEQTDAFGLVDTQWTLRGGLAEGEALQYYSNGSLFRELFYRSGRLDGQLIEYYEKGPYRRPPVRGRLANRQERQQAAGNLKKIMQYREGVPDGRYQSYYPDGILREEGMFSEGSKQDVVRYDRTGRPKGSAQEGSWTLKL